VDKGSHFIFLFIKTKETISIQSVIGGVVFGNCVGRLEILLGSSENRGREGLSESVIFCRHLKGGGGLMSQIIFVAGLGFEGLRGGFLFIFSLLYDIIFYH